MSLLQNSVDSYESNSAVASIERQVRQEKDEMTLRLKKVVRHKNAMPESLKKQKREGAVTLEKLLRDVLDKKGVSDSVEIYRNESNEVVIDGLSEQHLHGFLIKAEELGKNITYTRSLKVEITD